MNRQQQSVTRKLEDVLEEYLLSFGWSRDGRRWRHPRFENGTLACDTMDAFLQTRANPMLGWPNRYPICVSGKP